MRARGAAVCNSTDSLSVAAFVRMLALRSILVRNQEEARNDSDELDRSARLGRSGPAFWGQRRTIQLY